MQKGIDQDLIVYAGLALSGIVTIAIAAPGMISNYQRLDGDRVTNAAVTRDARIAEQRLASCTTGFVMDGTGQSVIQEGGVALEIETRQPFSPNTVLCDQSGATGVVDRTGRVTNIKVSSQARKHIWGGRFRQDNRVYTQP